MRKPAFTLTAPSGGGIVQLPIAGTLSLLNSLVATNRAATGPDLTGGPVEATSSLIGDTAESTLVDGGGNLFDVDGQRRQPGANGVGPFSIAGGTMGSCTTRRTSAGSVRSRPFGMT